jgi:TolB protein
MRRIVVGIGLLIGGAEFDPNTPQELNHEVLVTSVRTGDTEVFAVNMATGQARNLTQAPHSEERYPAWSPDGKRVIFTSNRSDGKTYNYYIADANGRNTKQLTHLPAGAVAYWGAFTADGQYIYFNEGNTATVMRIRPNGTEQAVVAEGRDAHISPDGRKLVYTQRGPKGFGVWVMDSQGRNRKQIIPNESEIGGIAPVWSADGRYVAFSMQVGDIAEVFTCRADGSELKQITNLKQISSSPAWSPDGKYLSFRVTNEAYWRDTQKMKKTYDEKAADKRPVWVIGADGSHPHVVEVLHYQCAMDGSRAEWKPIKS